MNVVHLGSQAEFVRIEVPDSYFRHRWAEADVEIAVPGFRGRITAWVEADDFEIFHQQLQSLYDSLQGVAELRPREEQFILVLTAGTGGHVKVSGEAWSYATHGSRLHFELELDQSYLPGPLAQLRDLQHGA